MCKLGIEHGASRRAAITPKFWAISLAPKFILFLRFSIRFSFFIFIVFACVWAHMYIGIWRPEIGIKVSIALHFTHLKQGLSVNPRICVTTSLPRQLALRVLCLCLPRLELHVTVRPGQHLCEVWGSELWTSDVHSKCFNPRPFSPACDGVFLRVIKASSLCS